MIAPGLAFIAVHALLYHHPFTTVSDDETVQVKVEAVLDRGTIDLCNKPAGGRKAGTIDADAVADGDQFVWRLPRMSSATAADAYPEILRTRSETALESADDAGGDAG